MNTTFLLVVKHLFMECGYIVEIAAQWREHAFGVTMMAVVCSLLCLENFSFISHITSFTYAIDRMTILELCNSHRFPQLLCSSVLVFL